MSQAQRAAQESRTTERAALFVVPDREPPATTVRVKVESDGPATLKFTITAA